MPMELRWVDDAELDRVALTRLRCYAKSAGELETFQQRARTDPRSKSGDYLLASIDGHDVGTATHVSLNMWVRGGRIPCQGVAWVGAIKTMRRKGAAGTPGVASAVMWETLRMGRERGDVVSALMPFRASYYEHFGYGIVERRCDWTVPIPVLPRGEFESVRFFEPSDFTARSECATRINHLGQCDVERADVYWKTTDTSAASGFSIIDREGNGPARGYLTFQHLQVDGKDLVKVTECFYQDGDTLRRFLYFLSSLKDQFATIQISLPADLPLNRLLVETQIPHRPVNHAVAEFHPYTRMQLRILDHKKFLEAIHLRSDAQGKVVVAVQECEGNVSRLKMEIEAGRIQCKPTNEAPQFECSDRTWAAVACGDLKASDAVRWGLASGDQQEILDVLADGPLPFCNEYF